MYIDKILLENIRGFEKLQFSLQRPDKSYAGWTVFTGDNGSGKSTLLKAIAIALVGPNTAMALQPNFDSWLRTVTRSEENLGNRKIKIVIVPDLISQSDKTSKELSEKISAQINFTLGHRNRATLHTKNNQDTSKANQTIWSTESMEWFSCGYGPFRRIFGASPEATSQMSAPVTKRFVTMFNEAASLSEVNQWLINLSHQTYEGKSDAQEKLDVIINLLNDDLLPNSVQVSRVDSEGVWLKEENGTQLDWYGMSDGYRSMLALLADIMRHLFEAFDHKTMVSRDKKGRLVVNASGVVLIDEIDAHLHPEWQMKIGFWLKERFPNIQFLVTTHSPIICQAADENGLFVLPSPDSDDEPRPISANEYKKIIASKSDTILLSSLFGLENTRSEKIVEMTMKYSDLIAKRQSGLKLTKDELIELKHLESITDDEDN